MRTGTLVILLSLLAACSEAPPPAAPPKLVRTLVVGDAATDGTQRSYSGEVRGRIETTLGFRIGGKIVERRVDTGAAVKAGQVLARAMSCPSRAWAARWPASIAASTST